MESDRTPWRPMHPKHCNWIHLRFNYPLLLCFPFISFHFLSMSFHFLSFPFISFHMVSVALLKSWCIKVNVKNWAPAVQTDRTPWRWPPNQYHVSNVVHIIIEYRWKQYATLVPEDSLFFASVSEDDFTPLSRRSLISIYINILPYYTYIFVFLYVCVLLGYRS